MPKFRMEIECGNAAFDGSNRDRELIRILKRVSLEVMSGFAASDVFDVNGNKVGWWTLDDAPEVTSDLDPSDPNFEVEPEELIPPADIYSGVNFRPFTSPDRAPGTAFLGEPPRPVGKAPELGMGYTGKIIPARPAGTLPPAFGEPSELHEVAGNMALTGLDTYQSCKDRVRAEMPDETETIVERVADALFLRLNRAHEGRKAPKR